MDINNFFQTNTDLKTNYDFDYIAEFVFVRFAQGRRS